MPHRSLLSLIRSAFSKIFMSRKPPLQLLRPENDDYIPVRLFDPIMDSKSSREACKSCFVNRVVHGKDTTIVFHEFLVFELLPKDSRTLGPHPLPPYVHAERRGGENDLPSSPSSSSTSITSI